MAAVSCIRGKKRHLPVLIIKCHTIASSDFAVATSVDMTPFKTNASPKAVGKSARLMATIKSNETSKPLSCDASSLGLAVIGR